MLHCMSPLLTQSGQPAGTRRLGNRFPYMRQYYFHVVDGVEIFDSLGARLPNDDAAREYAERVANDYRKAKKADAPTKAIRVTNDQGSILFRVPIRRPA